MRLSVSPARRCSSLNRLAGAPSPTRSQLSLRLYLFLLHPSFHASSSLQSGHISSLSSCHSEQYANRRLNPTPTIPISLFSDPFLYFLSCSRPNICHFFALSCSSLSLILFSLIIPIAPSFPPPSFLTNTVFASFSAVFFSLTHTHTQP